MGTKNRLEGMGKWLKEQVYRPFLGDGWGNPQTPSSGYRSDHSRSRIPMITISWKEPL